MSTKISGRAASARESARKSDGKFGEQEHERSDVSLGGDGDAPTREELIEQAVAAITENMGPGMEDMTRRELDGVSEAGMPLAAAAIIDRPTSRVTSDVIREADSLTALGYRGEDLPVIGESHNGDPLTMSVRAILEHQIDPEKARIIRRDIAPNISANLTRNSTWTRDSILTAKNPAAMADALAEANGGLDKKQWTLDAKTTGRQYRAVVTAEHPERAERIAEAARLGITSIPGIESGYDLQEIREIKDVLKGNEKSAIIALDNGFDAELSKAYGSRIATSYKVRGSDLREMEASGLDRADIKGTLTAFPHAQKEDIPALTKSRPGITTAQRRAYAKAAKEAGLSTKETADAMRRISPETLEGWSDYGTARAMASAKAVQTLEKAGIDSAQAVRERTKRTLDPISQRAAPMVSIEHVAATAHLSEQRIRDLSRAGVPLDKMPEVPADASAWNAGAPFRQAHIDGEKRRLELGIARREDGYLVSRDGWPWSMDNYRDSGAQNAAG